MVVTDFDANSVSDRGRERGRKGSREEVRKRGKEEGMLGSKRGGEKPFSMYAESVRNEGERDELLDNSVLLVQFRVPRNIPQKTFL